MTDSIHKIIQLTIAMTFIVIILGAYTRLKDAGLGCPDWPGCYGHILAPTTNEHFNQVAVYKAWLEMIHRYVAGSLGLLILYIAIKSLFIRNKFPQLWIYTHCVLGLVILQALLGMLTVSLGLYPVVVMLHLVGGFSILALLFWILLTIKYNKHHNFVQPIYHVKLLTLACIIVLFCQIALGGWTSANYAALVCADFPTCQGNLWPNMDWYNAFNFTKVGIFASPGEPLENDARVAIQMAHRLGALLSTIMISVLAYVLLRTKKNSLRIPSIILLILLCAQITLGIMNVLLELPVMISLTHNAVAALLFLCLIYILFLNVKRSTDK